jgi:hypothetical protein
MTPSTGAAGLKSVVHRKFKFYICHQHVWIIENVGKGTRFVHVEKVVEENEPLLKNNVAVTSTESVLAWPFFLDPLGHELMKIGIPPRRVKLCLAHRTKHATPCRCCCCRRVVLFVLLLFGSVTLVYHHE